MHKAVLFAAILLVAGAAQADGDTATFALVPYAPGGLSADGQTVVGENISSDSLWMWRADSGTVAIGGVSSINPGGGLARVSADGSRVYGAAVDANGVRNVSVYNVGTGTWTSLGGLGGYSYAGGVSPDPATNIGRFTATGSLWGSSGDGHYLVGQSYQGGNGTNNVRATIWNTETGTLTGLGISPYNASGPNQRTRAVGISDDGRVVGGNGGSSNPIVWTDFDGDGVYTTIKVSGNSDGVIVNGIGDVSADGMWAVGTGFINTASGSAYRFNTGTNTLEMLGTLGALTGARDAATGTNRDGSIIVGYEDDISLNPFNRVATIWIEGQGTQSLDSYLQGFGINTDGSFRFTTALSISDDGRNILGIGYQTGDTTARGFLVNLPAAAVPEASTCMLMAIGLGALGLGMRRRRPTGAA